MTPEQLKVSILQRAMEGKLVPQDPNDEPASELLKRIKEEKEKLISEGKVKRDKKETEFFRGDDGKPYEKLAECFSYCITLFVDFIGVLSLGNKH